MTKSLYVTTSIPYVNAPPHVGFALELVQADAIARYHRLLGATARLQTGTDENAFKNVLSARERGIPVEALVDENSERFRALCTTLDISADRFIRTTEPSHRRAVHDFLSRLREGDVYTAAYRALYCPGCEDFYLERELDDGRLCPDHRTPVLEVEERNYFFRLSAYQDQLHQLIASRKLRIYPEARETEVLRFIEQGLADISISRDAARSGGWGIPFPGDDSQVVYVWIDALINYLSGLGEATSRFWSDDTSKLHVIGKNVWKFHAIYWPVLLLSAGLPVPEEILVHGFLTSEGERISKSRGNSPDPTIYVERFSVDGVRHFLLRHVRPFDDTDFSVARLEASYTADLANGLGNLCSRLTTLCESASVPGYAAAAPPRAPAEFHEHCRAFRFDDALASLWGEIAAIDRELTSARPWEDIKAGRLTEARELLSGYVSRLDAVAYWLAPFLPSTAERIRTILSQHPIRKCPRLFPRLD
jgi:methionyl-tRNA synthetase